MNILFSMIYEPDKGGSGAPIYTNTLLKYMNNMGFKPGIVFSTNKINTDEEKHYYHSYPVYCERPPIFDDQPQVKNSIAFKNMNNVDIELYIDKIKNKFHNVLNEKKYDLLHVQHGMYIGYAAYLIKKELNVPYIISLHVMELNFIAEFKDPIKAMAAMVFADKICALSDDNKKRLLNEYNRNRIIELESKAKNITFDEAKEIYDKIIGDNELNEQNISVCPLGIDLDLFKISDDCQAYIHNKLKIPHNKKIVMFTGRLIEMKGILNLLKAERIYNPTGDVYTVIIGGGNLEATIIDEIKNNKNIIYVGYKNNDEICGYLNYARKHHGVFCVPSKSEGLSVVYLEAMASGLPVIACAKKDMGNMDFMQEPHVLFSKFGDINSLAEAIIKLLKEDNNPLDIRKKISQYSKENMCNTISLIYKNVIKDKS